MSAWRIGSDAAAQAHRYVCSLIPLCFFPAEMNYLNWKMVEVRLKQIFLVLVILCLLGVGGFKEAGLAGLEDGRFL